MITRYFSPDNFLRLQNDFRFLLKILGSYHGELELSLRDNYFNLYFGGNSAVKVTFRRDGVYKIQIHEKFLPTSLDRDTRFSIDRSGTYCLIEVAAAQLHPLLQKRYLDVIRRKINRERYSEELAFE